MTTEAMPAAAVLSAALSPAGWLSNWAWGLGITAVTLMLHAGAVVMISIFLMRLARRIEALSWSLRRLLLLVIVIVGIVGWALAVLHGIEAGIWACAYVWLGAISSPADAVLYSLDSFTTRGESGLDLAAHWRLLGALEATDGVLLFGISTAFLFTVIDSVRGLMLRIAERRRH